MRATPEACCDSASGLTVRTVRERERRAAIASFEGQAPDFFSVDRMPAGGRGKDSAFDPPCRRPSRAAAGGIEGGMFSIAVCWI